MVRENFLKISEKANLKPSLLSKFLCFVNDRFVTNEEIILTFGFSPLFVKRLKLALSDHLTFKNNLIAISLAGRKALLSEALLIRRKEEEFALFLSDSGDYLSKVKARFRKAKREYDQFFATGESVIHRAQVMLENGDLTGRKILLLGDDDFLSILLAKYLYVREVAVLDIDEEILKIIKEETLGKVFLLKHDLRLGLPKETLGKYNHVFTDPPYTKDGFCLFLSEGLRALDENKDNSIYICYGCTNEARERGLAIQKLISDAGILISEKREGFNTYLGAESVGSKSSLYILKRTHQTKMPLPYRKDRVYTYEQGS